MLAARGSTAAAGFRWRLRAPVVPWAAMTGDFVADVFPPAAGDSVGFTVLGIDYDNGALDWFATNAPSLPWQGNGLETMTFIERPAQ